MTSSLCYQFNASDADLILVSCETETENPARLNVHKTILVAASPFFETLFGLPQSSVSEFDSSTVPDKPPMLVIHMTESRVVLPLLLQFIYPTPDPEISSLDVLSSVLEAAIKYDLNAVVCTLRRILIEPRFVTSTPTRVYAIATRYDLEMEAKAASKYTLPINVLDCPLSDDLKFISAYSYHRLLNLHRSRARNAQNLLRGAKLPDNIKCMQCNGSAYSTFLLPKWWDEFLKRAEEELRVRPMTDVIFGLKFLAEVAHASGCVRCPQSMLEAYGFLEKLKGRIDDLAETI